MRALIASLALALAACGQTSAPPASEPADTASAPAAVERVGEPMSAGLMGGMTDGMPDDIAAVSPAATQLVFTNPDGEESATTSTEFLGVVPASTLIASGGESFAATARNDVVTRAEVRRITGAAPAGLCGGAATHVALVSSEPLTGLFLIAFTGADAPGFEARDSVVCAVNAYAVD